MTRRSRPQEKFVVYLAAHLRHSTQLLLRTIIRAGERLKSLTCRRRHRHHFPSPIPASMDIHLVRISVNRNHPSMGLVPTTECNERLASISVAQSCHPRQQFTVSSHTFPELRGLVKTAPLPHFFWPFRSRPTPLSTKSLESATSSRNSPASDQIPALKNELSPLQRTSNHVGIGAPITATRISNGAMDERASARSRDVTSPPA